MRCTAERKERTKERESARKNVVDPLTNRYAQDHTGRANLIGERHREGEGGEKCGWSAGQIAGRRIKYETGGQRRGRNREESGVGESVVHRRHYAQRGSGHALHQRPGGCPVSNFAGSCGKANEGHGAMN